MVSPGANCRRNSECCSACVIFVHAPLPAPPPAPPPGVPGADGHIRHATLAAQLSPHHRAHQRCLCLPRTHLQVRVCVCVCVCMHACVCVCGCMHACACVYTCVCTYVYVCTANGLSSQVSRKVPSANPPAVFPQLTHALSVA